MAALAPYCLLLWILARLPPTGALFFGRLCTWWANGLFRMLRQLHWFFLTAVLDFVAGAVLGGWLINKPGFLLGAYGLGILVCFGLLHTIRGDLARQRALVAERVGD